MDFFNTHINKRNPTLAMQEGNDQLDVEGIEERCFVALITKW